MKVIGITGSIGCGKTTLAAFLQQRGYIVFDADKEVAALYARFDVLDALKKVFPDVFVGDNLDKKLLRQRVFGNQACLSRLEGIIYPYLLAQLESSLAEVKNKNGLFFIDAALIFEKGWRRFCDRIVCVHTDYETQKQRVMQRDHINEDDFIKIYKSQMDNAEKCRLADFVVDMNGSLEHIESQAEDLIIKLKDC